MLEKPESRCPMRQKVRSLAKFQMLRLTNRRESRKSQDQFVARSSHQTPEHVELPKSDPIAQWEIQQRLGFPGYRTISSHTGLDPIESLTELAFLLGRFIRLLIRGQLHTHNLFYLIGMSIAGLCLVIPFMLLVAESRFSGWNEQSIWLGVLLTPLAAAGLALWMNVNANVQSHNPQSVSH